MSHIDIVFDGPPGPTPGRFVEVEQEGKSLDVGTWIKRDDGYWVLRILTSEPQSAGRDRELEAADEIAAQLAELVECAERDLKMNRDEEPGGHWSLRTANCFLPARYALATYRSLKQEGGA
jgi:hypothetical protein